MCFGQPAVAAANDFMRGEMSVSDAVKYYLAKEIGNIWVPSTEDGIVVDFVDFDGKLPQLNDVVVVGPKDDYRVPNTMKKAYDYGFAVGFDVLGQCTEQRY